MANATEITACSSSTLSLSSLQFYDGGDQKVHGTDSLHKGDSYVEDQGGELDIIEKNENMLLESDTPHEDIHDDSSEGRLSGLEFVVDSDCGDSDSAFGEATDETENQSPFYYVLEESEKTQEKKLYPSVSLV